MKCDSYDRRAGKKIDNYYCEVLTLVIVNVTNRYVLRSWLVKCSPPMVLVKSFYYSCTLRVARVLLTPNRKWYLEGALDDQSYAI